MKQTLHKVQTRWQKDVTFHFLLLLVLGTFMPMGIRVTEPRGMKIILFIITAFSIAGIGLNLLAKVK